MSEEAGASIEGVDLEFIKNQENPGLRHGLRHKSPEGGTDTIGYGHKLTAAEDRAGEVYGIKLDGMTKADAETILEKDIQAKAKSAKRKYEEKYDGSWDDLTGPQRHLFLDFEYNLGNWKKFPSFFDAVVENDVDGMIQEYKRYFTDPNGERKEIKSRNQATHGFILDKFVLNPVEVTAERRPMPQRPAMPPGAASDMAPLPASQPRKPPMNGMLDTGMPRSPAQVAPVGQQSGMLMTPRGDVVNPLEPKPMPEKYSF